MNVGNNEQVQQQTGVDRSQPSRSKRQIKVTSHYPSVHDILGARVSESSWGCEPIVSSGGGGPKPRGPACASHGGRHQSPNCRGGITRHTTHHTPHMRCHPTCLPRCRYYCASFFTH
ncbi:hypothetical protein E2C01_004786 [Portunus trituberculatus]|uniref:Uncharacterized protein n=1 Tax=Portunus trituberculatus TaxID=210409 RepID=A0A5B7CSK7_PORTR|nr:hypothetical protein [Portunus trituberculatus]